MNTRKHVLLMLALVCLCGFSSPATAAEDKGLYGSWEGVSFGKFVYTFAEKGKVTLKLIFETEDPPMVLEGTYTVDDGTISIKLPSEPGGKPDEVLKGKYEIKGDTLIITSEGEEQKLTKVKE